MKGMNVLFAFLGGAAVGAVAGILLAHEKGADTRARICKLLHEKGIHLKKEEMEHLVDQIAEEVKGGVKSHFTTKKTMRISKHTTRYL